VPRVVCIFLSDWPMTRLRRAGLAPEPGPHAVAAAGPGGLRLVALDREAWALGLRPGELLGRVRARVGVPLHIHPADPEAETEALGRLCRWAMRYAPTVAPFGPAEGGHGLYIDVEGASHLLGGEKPLLDDLAGRLVRAEVPARIALADTPGAAFALARHGAEPCALVPPGGGRERLSALPVEALRLESEAAGLRKVGLRKVGDVEALPRAALARRFGLAPLLRLDQLFGRRPEPLAPLADSETFSATRGFLDPIGRQADVVATARALMQEIAPRLERAGLGACALRLTLHRIDGVASCLDFGLSRPDRCAERVAALIGLRLDRLGEALDAGFGFETVGLAVTTAEPMPDRQAALGGSETGERVATLADILAQRIGRRLTRLAPRESHRPEKAEGIVPWTIPRLPYPDHLPVRPLVLFPRGEAAQDVFATAPDGPPHRFRWRAQEHRVARAEGPERIAPEWWHEAGEPRDYYRIECEAGRRLWLYRDGPHGRDKPAAWFVHGVFS
jgi:protein ImuB